MANVPELTEAEWKIMKVLWTQSPQPAYDIAQTLAETEQWQINTVRTLLTRLHHKRAVSAKKYKNLFLYEPLVTEDECVQAESDSFLERFFGGSLKPLLVHFARRQKLSAADLAELSKMLDEGGKEPR